MRLGNSGQATRTTAETTLSPPPASSTCTRWFLPRKAVNAAKRTVTLPGLNLAAPDGLLLFDHLDLCFGAERSGLVGRNGIAKTTMLRAIAGELRSQSGKITIGGNIAFLRQAVQPLPDEAIVELFGALLVISHDEAPSWRPSVFLAGWFLARQRADASQFPNGKPVAADRVSLSVPGLQLGGSEPP